MAHVSESERLETAGGRKRYVPPTLVKGPVLARVISADSKVSGISSDSETCWVARAAFGAADIRWMIFREWLVADAPAELRAIYLRYGETFGAWLAGHAWARTIVRAAMMPVIRTKVRQTPNGDMGSLHD